MSNRMLNMSECVRKCSLTKGNNLVAKNNAPKADKINDCLLVLLASLHHLNSDIPYP